jgi:regulator of sirC expression with transglutaminase-like and TPR domain
MRFSVLWSVAVLFCAAGLVSAAEEKAPEKPAAATQLPMAAPGIEALVEKVRPSVVVVNFTDRDGTALGVGSGVIIREDGLIATNLHVLGEARPVQVRLLDGRTFMATQIYAHEKSQDLAILKIDATGLPALPLGDSEAIQVGQSVVAVGNPQGLEHSVVAGVVSALRDNIDGMAMIQLAIPIERGNSGGPVVDLEGNVLGLMTLKSLVTDNLGYAVAVNSLKPLLEKPNPIPMSKWLTIGVLNPKHWETIGDARWTQHAGRLKAQGQASGIGGRSLCLSTQTPPEPPFEAVVSVKLTEPDGAAGIAFGSDGGEKHFGFYPSSGSLRVTRFDGPTVYDWHVLWEEARSEYRPGEWNELRIHVERERVQCFCNGVMVYELHDPKAFEGRLGLAKFRHTTAEFKGFRIAAKIDAPAIDEMVRTAIAKTAEEANSKRPPLAKDISNAAGFGASGRAAALEEADKLERRATWLRRLASSTYETDVCNQIAAALSPPNGEPDLLTATLLIGALDDPDLDVAFYRNEVDDLATELRKRFTEGMTGPQKLAELHKLLFDDNGFHGSRTNYYSAANSHLNEVIDDREGLPITLSVLYIEVARRAGLRVEGVGLPGHFIVRALPEGADPQLVDVYERGAFLTKQQALAKVFQNGADWDESVLDAVTARQIIVRVLRNLVSTLNPQENQEQALRYVNALLAAEPESVTDRLFRAVLSLDTGRLDEALADVDMVIAKHPKNIDLARVQQLKDAIERKRDGGR